MNIVAQINQANMRKVNDMLESIEKYTRKNTSDLLRQIGIFAAQSAAKVTKPGKSSGKKLPKKYMYRPLEKLPENINAYVTETGHVFTAKQKISNKALRRRHMKRVTKGVKKWQKKENRWTYIPYAGKRDLSKKIFKIPHAGLAKKAWLFAFISLRKKRARANTDIASVYSDKFSLRITNEVRYVSNSSPKSAVIGLLKARRRMEKIYWPKIKKKIEARARR